jgi:hypothetical protein
MKFFEALVSLHTTLDELAHILQNEARHEWDPFYRPLCAAFIAYSALVGTSFLSSLWWQSLPPPLSWPWRWGYPQGPPTLAHPTVGSQQGMWTMHLWGDLRLPKANHRLDKFVAHEVLQSPRATNQYNTSRSNTTQIAQPLIKYQIYESTLLQTKNWKC